MVRFGPFAVDIRTWRLSRDGDPIELSPRLVEILVYLVERNGARPAETEPDPLHMPHWYTPWR